MNRQEGKWVFIVNPTAGNNFGKTLILKLEEEIIKHRIDGEIFQTKYHGHAGELASTCAQNGSKYIIAVGGDGTFNEVASALVYEKDITLGIIPAGTGNDFIQILGFPGRFKEEHWDNFFNCETQNMDVGQCNNTYFFNGMGLGFDAEVAAQNYDKNGKARTGGKDKYIYHIVKTLLFYKEKMMKLVTNGETKQEACFMNTISIGRRFAGDFLITPKAIANDGLLDVCAVKKMNIFQRFRILPQVPKGEHITDKNVHYYTTDKLNLEFDQKVPFHVDGELYFSSKFEVRIIPNMVKIIYNPNGNHFFGKDL